MAIPLIAAVLDLVLPPSCSACGGSRGEEGVRSRRDPLCRRCRRDLPLPVTRCAACGRRMGPHPPEPSCPRCSGPFAVADGLRWSGSARGLARRAIQGVIVAYEYASTARSLVLALKFRARYDAAGPLVEGMAEALLRADVPGDLLVPVPLSRRRRRQRGYNQAHVLARGLARTLDLEVCTRALRRRRHDRPQSGRSPSARRRGPRGAFVAHTSRVRERCVLLVDDVLTSGATARACALALRRAHARSVVVAVACRADGRGAGMVTAHGFRSTRRRDQRPVPRRGAGA